MLIINVDKPSFDSQHIYTNDLASFASLFHRFVDTLLLVGCVKLWTSHEQ